MRFLPVFLDLSAGGVVLVGSGEPAINKLRLLSAAGARVRWYVGAGNGGLAQATAAELRLADIETSDPLAADWSDATLVVSAAGGPLDDAVAARARAMRIPVNVVDRPDLSGFIMPAIVDRGDVVVAIGTGGAAPVLARRLRERIEALLPARIGELASLMQRYRDRVSARIAAFSERRRFWQRVVDGPVADAIYAGRAHDAEATLIAALDDAREREAGTVFLVGAGPGDPDLLTLRALHALQDADVVFYDELVTPAILDRARRDAERVLVGKRRGQPGIGQGEINRRLVEAARAGKHVVRLKSGDPFVFGRGGEELEYLRAAGIPAIVVPGITAALGCAACAGIPLTHRDYAHTLVFVTGHTRDGMVELNWPVLTQPRQTVVVYMGIKALGGMCRQLIAHGLAPTTKAAVVENGAYEHQRVIAGTLATLPGRVPEHQVCGPALVVIGEVVGLHETLAWFAGAAAAPEPVAGPSLD
jgi:uroporphyrin-III C-methyltransferase / precorrin-2 dehydrogenase / sirohydrochlorin ferrochelatase